MLLSTKPLSEPLVIYHTEDRMEQHAVEIFPLNADVLSMLLSKTCCPIMYGLS